MLMVNIKSWLSQCLVYMLTMLDDVFAFLAKINNQLSLRWPAACTSVKRTTEGHGPAEMLTEHLGDHLAWRRLTLPACNDPMNPG